MTESKSWAMSLLEKVFGKLGVTEREPTRRRCARCGTRFKMTERKPEIKGSILGPRGTAMNDEEVERWNRERCYDSMRFCSWQCSVNEDPQPGELTRQRLRQLARVQAKREIREMMGAGPGAANPRRARRRAVFKMAARLHRERT